jgi:nucleoside-diphosphate-sugar epimerase
MRGELGLRNSGVSGVTHVASNLTFDSDPNKVIPEVLAGVNGILKSAAKEPSVKRFVYTSSSTAITAPIPNKEFIIDENG